MIHIWLTAFGAYYDNGYGNVSPVNKYWVLLHDKMAREQGVFTLSETRCSADVHCKNYLLQSDTPGALDVIELSFRIIDRSIRDLDGYEKKSAGLTQTADNAIEELNHRFLEHAIGYQYVEGILVRLDSQFLHAEAVKPALSLLNDAGFDGPADEFLRAFDHYRHGRNKESVAEALKAFESTMKAVCAARKWSFPKNATAKPLLDTLFVHGIVPAELQSHFAGFRSAMESGLPTLSNRTSRHGQGAAAASIPPHFASYALHLTASNIVFLVEAHKSIK